ncbi:hypothetical protein ACHWQZ_G005770 [Mnemiopsis leidyi]
MEDDVAVSVPRREKLDKIEKELAELLCQLRDIGIELDVSVDEDWDTVYSVEVMDTTQLRDELELFLELCDPKSTVKD